MSRHHRIPLLALLVALAITAVAPAVWAQRQGGAGPAGRQGGDGGQGRPAARPDERGRSGRDPAEPRRTGTATIRGLIVATGTSSPIRRATIVATLTDGGDGPRTMQSDDNGAFEFRSLPAGRWNVTASKTGFLDYASYAGSGDTFDVDEGESAVVNIALSRGGAITGRIFDEFGDPIANATVIASRLLSSSRGVRLVRTGTSVPTDETGAYRVYGLPPGLYYVSVSDPSAGNMGVVTLNPAEVTVVRAPDGTAGGRGVTYAPTYYPGTANIAEAQRIMLALGQEQSGVNLSIVPVRTARITGRIVGPNGAPLRASVALSSSLGQGFTPAGGRNATGTDGTFTLTNIPPGSYTLNVLGPNIGAAPPAVASMPLNVYGEDLTGLTITAGGGATIDGTIVAGSGARLDMARARVTAIAAYGDTASWTPRAEVNTNGSFELEGLLGVYTFRIDGLPDGWIVKSITANGTDVTDSPVLFRIGDRILVRVEVTDRVTLVTGVVKFDRASARGATLIVFADDPARWTPTSRFVRTVRVNGDGSFALEGLPPHDRYLAVAMDFLDSGEAQLPEFLQQIRGRASLSFSLNAGEEKDIDVPVVQR